MAAVTPQITPVNTEDAVGASPNRRKRMANRMPNAANASSTEMTCERDMAWRAKLTIGNGQGHDPTRV
jgi:hypothetical protein